jgi:hypothetical protein
MAGRTRRDGLQAPTSARFSRAEVGVRVLAQLFCESLDAIANPGVLPGVLGINPAVPQDGCPAASPSLQSRDSDS